MTHHFKIDFQDKSNCKKGKFNNSRKTRTRNKFKVWSRRSTISVIHDRLSRFLFYNGKRFLLLPITENMVGHKFGEFSFTKRMSSTIHSFKTKKET